MFTYETNLFKKGRKAYSKQTTLSEAEMIFHTGKTSRSAFMDLINRWNRQGLINVESHGNVYVYVAL